MKKTLPIALLFLFLLLPQSVFARIGVGVATGKIQVHDKLKPGIIYSLPPLTVVNTGDVPSDYEVEVTYFETQKEQKPPNSWFSLSPQKFHLEPGGFQVVNIKINLPVAVSPGDYFGFLEAHPVKNDKAGQTSIGIAAATKLYFSVSPANIFYGIYYKVLSFWQVYSPWPQRALSLLIIIILGLFARKFLNIQIGIKKPKSTKAELPEVTEVKAESLRKPAPSVLNAQAARRRRANQNRQINKQNKNE